VTLPGDHTGRWRRETVAAQAALAGRPRRRTDPRARPAFLALTVLGALAAALAVWFAVAPPWSSVPAPRTLASPAATVTVPGTFAVAPARREASAGLLAPARATAPQGEGTIGVGLALARTGPPLGGRRARTPVVRATRLGAVGAFRVTRLRNGAIVFAVPTDRGIVAVRCTGAAARAACPRAAASLRLRGRRPVATAVDARHTRRLDRALARMERTAAPLRRRLARTGSRTRQVAAADGLRRAAARAHARLLRLTPPPSWAAAHTALARETGAVARAYATATRALRTGDRRRITRAAARVRTAEVALVTRRAAPRPGHVPAPR
jgi:hypothetical protein